MRAVSATQQTIRETAPQSGSPALASTNTSNAIDPVAARRTGDLAHLLRQYDPSGNLVTAPDATVAPDKNPARGGLDCQAGHLAMPPK
jgi:hypothetical protein